MGKDLLGRWLARRLALPILSQLRFKGGVFKFRLTVTLMFEANHRESGTSLSSLFSKTGFFPVIRKIATLKLGSTAASSI
jgi:hypothetical protein